MLHISGYRYSNLLRGSVLCGLLITLLAVLPVSARAQCGNWSAAGERLITREQREYDWTRPKPPDVSLTLKQAGKVITGTASVTVNPAPGFKWGGKPLLSKLDGTVAGMIVGDSLSMDITWKGGSVDVYKAKILPSGELEGHPEHGRGWSFTNRLTCLPIPKPIARTGRKPDGAATALKAPGIVVGPVSYPFPGAPNGTVVLTWDGGPDHPNVAVWLSIDNGAEIPAFSVDQVAHSPVWKQPKASFALQLRRGHHYRLVLKDRAGRTLSSSAGFVVP